MCKGNRIFYNLKKYWNKGIRQGSSMCYSVLLDAPGAI